MAEEQARPSRGQSRIGQTGRCGARRRVQCQARRRLLWMKSPRACTRSARKRRNEGAWAAADAAARTSAQPADCIATGHVTCSIQCLNGRCNTWQSPPVWALTRHLPPKEAFHLPQKSVLSAVAPPVYFTSLRTLAGQRAALSLPSPGGRADDPFLLPRSRRHFRLR